MQQPNFHEFNLQILPHLLATKNGEAAVHASRELDPLCIRLKATDNAYTYQPRELTIDVIAGTEACMIVELEEASWLLLMEGRALLLGLLEPSLVNTAPDFFTQWQQVLQKMFTIDTDLETVGNK